MTDQQAKPRPMPEPQECQHQWHPHTPDVAGGSSDEPPVVRTCAFCGRPNWDDIAAVIDTALANDPRYLLADARAVAVDNAWLHARVGRPVIVRNPQDRDMWQGTLHAIHDQPTVVVDQGCGQHVTLPQSLEIEDAPPPAVDDVDEQLLWVLRKAMDDWGPAGVADVAARLAGRQS